MAPYRASVLSELRRAITNVAVPHHESPAVARRRRIVVAVTLVIGAAVLGFSLRRAPGESSFYWLTLVLAAVWIFGAFVLRAAASGRHQLAWPQPAPGHLRRGHRTAARRHLRAGRPDRQGDSAGRGLDRPGAAIRKPRDVALRRVDHLGQRSRRRGVLPRRALHRVGPAYSRWRFRRSCTPSRRWPAATRCSASPPSSSGFVCALERRASGGVLAPMLTHFVWGLIMVLALPPLFGL